MATPLTAAEFQSLTGVSRETLDRLSAHLELLRTWQTRINLVSARSLDDAWRRHILDSAQLMPLLPLSAQTLVDLGSGAGFPGLVLAILGVSDVHLVESDRRKIAFLREAARLTETPVTLHDQRIEALPVIKAEVVTARACAALPQLLDYAAPFLSTGAIGIFPKGRSVDEELTAAREKWNMRVDRYPSRTDSAATLLVITDVERS